MTRSFFGRGLRFLMNRISDYLDNSREKKSRIVRIVAGAADNLYLDEEHVDDSISALKGEKSKHTPVPSEESDSEELGVESLCSNLALDKKDDLSIL